MTNTEIRIVVAEKCGWTDIDSVTVGPTRPYGFEPNSSSKQPRSRRILPDYPGDLNACHEMEQSLTSVQWNLYAHFLEVVIRADIVSWLPDWQDINPSRLIDACLVHLTASQRCEAFLRTHGLWKE